MNKNFPAAALGLSIALAFGASAIHAADEPYTQAQGAESDQPVSDTWITTKVKSTLLASGDVSGTDINVSTTNGVVTLAGVLDSQAEVDRAVAVARDIEGVVSVDSRALEVR